MSSQPSMFSGAAMFLGAGMLLGATLPWRRALLWGAVLALGASWSTAEERVSGAAERLDLERVVELTLGQSPGLRAELERRAEVEGAVAETAADAWPQISAFGSLTQARSPALLNSPDFDDFIDQLPDFRPRNQELWSLGLEINQPIYSGGRLKAAIDLARLVVEITDAQLAAASLDAAAESAEAYFRLLAAEEALAAAEGQERARRESLAVVEARLEIGEATRLEQLRARAALARVAPTVVRARGDIEVQRSRLRLLLGLEPRATMTPVEVAGELPESPPLEVLRTVAESHRPEIVDLRLQREALLRQRRINTADGRPRLELDGRYGHQAREVENLGDALYSDWQIGLSMEWSLFDGGRRRGRAAQLESQMEQVRWRLAELESQIVFEIEEGYSEYRAAVSGWRASVAASEAASEAYRVAGESYQQGVALQADLISAQDEETQAALERVAAEYEARIQLVRLRRALGLLPSASELVPEESR